MIKHRHPRYEEQWQPTQASGKRMRNEDTPPPHPVADDEQEPSWEPDYEAIMERRHEKNRPDWA